ncbi:MAG: class I SAM-dependent methyltransferase [Thiohalocapsa sp.]
MWWFAALHANLLLPWQRLAAPLAIGKPLLDAGCGTGGLLVRLGAAYPEHAVIGLDADAAACASAYRKSGAAVCAGSVNALPFAERSFAAVFSADVLCHRDVDERAALAQFHRVLCDGGLLVLNLPAYRWMLSRHDAAVANVRRYTRASIVHLLAASGFRLLFASYWNFVLFPLMVLTRKLLPSSRRPGNTLPASDVRLYPAPLDRLGRIATGVETALLRRGIGLPCGGSVIAVAAKRGSREPGTDVATKGTGNA